MTYATRFAPSPTGPLHLGHAYSAILGHDRAIAKGGRFLLRIEDIDRARSKPKWEAQIYDDLQWLGITWDGSVLRQSERLRNYEHALQDLWQRGLLYACHCNRKDIMAAASAPQEGDGLIYGPDGVVYPGTCRDALRSTDPFPRAVALRLNMQRAMEALGRKNFQFSEQSSGEIIDFTAQEMITEIGDIVLSRKDFVGSYHLSVVLDDAEQGITEVMRGEDLFEATKIHVVLQRLLGLPVPTYYHHTLIRDAQGKRLAKRDDARAIAIYRAKGCSLSDIRKMVGLG